MGVVVYNISTTSAKVSWPMSPGCLDTFYSVMYDPNWNSLLMGYKRKSFMHEERIPVSQTSMHLGNLLPQTAYFLCVTCQAANPVRDQCQVFSTAGESGDGHERAGWELAMGVWLTCCVLLLLIAAILLWGCLRAICSAHGGVGGARAGDDDCHVAAAGSSRRSSSVRLYGRRGSSGGGAKLGAMVQCPLLATQADSRVITQGRELRPLAKLSAADPQ